MRHPVDRAFSHFVHRHSKELRRGQPFDRSFEEHVAEDPMCIDSSLYALQLEQYFPHFPKDQILALGTNDFREDLAGTLAQVYRFLGVADLPGQPPPLSAQERNESDTYLQHKLLDQVNAPFRRFNKVRRLARAVIPAGVRSGIYRLLLHTPRGKRLTRELMPPQMTLSERKKWIEFFEPHNQHLEQIINRRFPDWRT